MLAAEPLLIYFQDTMVKWQQQLNLFTLSLLFGKCPVSLLESKSH